MKLSNNPSGQFFCATLEVYVSGDKYGIVSLQNLALSKLKRNLEKLVIFPSQIQDICDMIRFCYEDTPSDPKRNDPLRALVAHFAACVVEYLAPAQEFQLVIEELGAFSRALVTRMKERLD